MVDAIKEMQEFFHPLTYITCILQHVSSVIYHVTHTYIIHIMYHVTQTYSIHVTCDTHIYVYPLTFQIKLGTPRI